MTLYISLISSGASKDIDWLGPQGLDLHGIKERGNKCIIFVVFSLLKRYSDQNYVFKEFSLLIQ